MRAIIAKKIMMWRGVVGVAMVRRSWHPYEAAGRGINALRERGCGETAQKTMKLLA